MEALESASGQDICFQKNLHNCSMHDVKL